MNSDKTVHKSAEENPMYFLWAWAETSITDRQSKIGGKEERNRVKRNRETAGKEQKIRGKEL